jgi:hypothetical protein
VSVSIPIKAACRTSKGPGAGKRAHAVRGFFNDTSRWGCGRFCHGRCCGGERTYPVGAGSHVTERIWTAISAGAFGKTTRDSHHAQPRRRCSLGYGGRVALHVIVFGDWRNLGHPSCIGFHGDQAAGNTGRGQQSILLADTSGGRARSECRTKSLAHCITAVWGTSPRSASPRRSALAGGTVPLAPDTSRHMGGNL